jgi:hypothetical protein
VPESVQYLQLGGAPFRPLAGEPVEVVLAVATRGGEDSPLVRKVRDAVIDLMAQAGPA